MIKLLHFADAHIDIAAHGKRDPNTGLPFRTLDFLRSLDTIVDTAIKEKVDLVIFAGDAYKDRTPAPTFQREWEKRIIKLSQEGIQTVLLMGNHDLSPSLGRAHALQEFDTLKVPNIHVVDRPTILSKEHLNNLQVQILALPWLFRSSFFAGIESKGISSSDINSELEIKVQELIETWLNEIEEDIPTILTAHLSIQGAVLGGERSIMLGNDIVVPGSVVKDKRLDYVALGHIHKAQNINEGQHPPIIYPGSIERVDFGESQDEKYFVITEIEKGKSNIRWVKLDGRHFVDRYFKIEDHKAISDQILQALGPKDNLKDAIVRLIVEYPRDFETMINESEIRKYAEEAFEFHFIRRPIIESRLRLPDDHMINEMSDRELIELYLKSIALENEQIEKLNKIAPEFLSEYLS